MTTPKILTILRTIYLPAGIFINEKYDKFILLHVIVFNILSVVVVIGVTAAYFDENSSHLETMALIYSAFTLLGSYWAGRLQSHHYKALYHEIQRFADQCEEFAQISDKMIEAKTYAIIGVWCIQLLTVPVPLYAVMFTDTDYQDFLGLLYPTWYPWKRDSLAKYAFTMVLQFISLCFGYCLLSCFVGTLCCATLYVYTRFLLLQQKIATMEERALMKTRRVTDNFHVPPEFTFLPSQRIEYTKFYEKFDDLVYQEFVCIVKEHQNLLKITKETIRNFTLPVEIVFGYGYVTVVTLSAIVLKEGPEHNVHKMKVSAFSSVAITSFSICCICAEVILHLNESLKNAVFDIEWYKHSYRMKKHLLIFMMQSQQTYSITVCGMFILSLNYLGNWLRLCYSCIQVLSSRSRL